jgi:hypothetical protein
LALCTIKTMNHRIKIFFNRHWSYVITDLRIYKPLLIILFFLTICATFKFDTWAWVSRSGSILVVFGAVLGLRRHFRLGSENAEAPLPPDTIKEPGAKAGYINVSAINEKGARKYDLVLQAKGLKIAVFGTLLWGYGDAVLQLIYPL